MRTTPLARTLAAAALALAVMACGDDGGDDTAAFCDRLGDLESAFGTDESLDPDALDALDSLAEDAPDEVRDAMEYFAELGRQFAEAGDDQGAQLEVLAGLDPAEAEDATSELDRFARDECDLELDITDGIEVTAGDGGDDTEATTEPDPEGETEPSDEDADAAGTRDPNLTFIGEEAGPGDVDACSLLTDEEVGAVFAGTIDPEISAIGSYPAPEGTLASCQWTSGGGVHVAVRVGPTDTIVIDADEETSVADVAETEGWTEVDGIAEGAWFDGDSTVAGVLYVEVEDGVAMEVTGPAEADDLQGRLEDAARAALDRL